MSLSVAVPLSKKGKNQLENGESANLGSKIDFL